MNALLCLLMLSQLPPVGPTDSYIVSDSTYYGATAVLCRWEGASGGVFEVLAVDDGAGGYFAAYGDEGDTPWTGEPILDVRIFKAAATQYGLTGSLGAGEQAVFERVDASDYCSDFPAVCPAPSASLGDVVEALETLTGVIASAALLASIASGFGVGMGAWKVVLLTKDLTCFLSR